MNLSTLLFIYLYNINIILRVKFTDFKIDPSMFDYIQNDFYLFF